MKIDKNMLKIPVIGIMLRTFYSAEFARNFALLIKSGIKLTDALSQCSNALRNRHLTNILKKARTNIINGAPLTETISTPNAFSPMLLSMINIGEKTGSLDTLLDEQANYHYELLDKYINRFSAIISFLMIVLVAGTLAFIFAAILLTYFS